MVNTLLLHQHEVEAEMRKLQATILQLVQPLVVPIALVEQPVSSHSGLPEKFGGEADKMKNFIGQCELFMGTRAAEFPTDHAKVSFILSLLKKSAAKWAQPIIESNDPIMNNYQNFMERFKATWDLQNVYNLVITKTIFDTKLWKVLNLQPSI
uniref:DUF4939 domain-containing protein n=1 Tax=Pseudonaja textilis TaxID=8673 RepID=A0A670ZDR8_PSETE